MWYSLKLGLILISGTWLMSNLGNSVFIDTQGQAAEPYFFPKEPIKYESECIDHGKNCSKKIHLCKNESYISYMKKECALSCRFCEKKTKILDLLPDIQSMDEIIALKKLTKSASSLSKTIIKGTCFDEYVYCGEFISLCDQEEYEELMSRHCSLTCGRCDVQHKERDTCEDHADCEGMSPLCSYDIYKDMMQEKCKKTCGFCKPETTGCKDRHKNCKGFKNDGFCENEIYDIDERSYLCGTTCGLCKDTN